MTLRILKGYIPVLAKACTALADVALFKYALFKRPAT